MDILDSIGTWVDRLKRLHGIVQQAKNVELMEELAALRIDLSKWKAPQSQNRSENGAVKKTCATCADNTTIFF